MGQAAEDRVDRNPDDDPRPHRRWNRSAQRTLRIATFLPMGLAWLVLTPFGLVILFILMLLEAHGFFGPTMLRDQLWEAGWRERRLSHPAVAILLEDAGPRLAVIMDEDLDPDDPRIFGWAELEATWTRGWDGVRDRPATIATVEVATSLRYRGSLWQEEVQVLRLDFLALQRTWGNGDLVDILLKGPNPGLVAIPRPARWDLVLGRIRGHIIQWMFVASLLINLVRALTFIGAVMTRTRSDDIRAQRLSEGLCPDCQYPVTGLPTRICPECGTKLPTSPSSVLPTSLP